MCGYCDVTSERQIPLVDIDLDLGFAGMARLAISIEDYQEETYMNLLLQSFGLRSKNIQRIQRINFCPFCGKEFKKGEGDER